MGSVADLLGERAYLDANIVIYFMEGGSPFSAVIDALAMESAAKRVACRTSLLTLTEVLAGMAQDEDPGPVQRVVDFFEDGGFFETLETTPKAFFLAGIARGRMRIKTPDALHLATALDHDYRYFLTNDRRLRSPWPERLAVVQIGDLSRA